MLLIAPFFLFTKAENPRPSVLLDGKLSGGYWTEYFDLGDHGFVLVFSRIKSGERVASKTELPQIAYYYSKDLSQRAVMRFNTNPIGIISFYANANHLFLTERNIDNYRVRMYDYKGDFVIEKKFSLNSIGLTIDMVSRVFASNDDKLFFETDDLLQQVHLYAFDLMKDFSLNEIDIPYPSGDPLESMAFKTEWIYLDEYDGYHVFYRRGSSREFDADDIKFHIAYYDENFNLYRELYVDNVLAPGQKLFGKEVSLIINPVTRSLLVGGYFREGGRPKAFFMQYPLYSQGSLLNRSWRRDFSVISNEVYRLIDEDSINVPLPPTLSKKGVRNMLSISRNRISVNEETINQLVVVDSAGNVQFNDVQMGNFETLNLDGFCVDAQKMYSRLVKRMMNLTLRSYCQNKSAQALDIDIDDRNNELLIIQDEAKNQVAVYYFKSTVN